MDTIKDEVIQKIKTEIEDVETSHDDSVNLQYIQYNGNIDNEKFSSEIEMQNITEESGLNEDIFEPCSCPFCERTVLKNKTYLIKHLQQFHKDFKLSEESTSNVHEEEETKMSEDAFKTWQKEWNARIDAFKTWQNEWRARIDTEYNAEDMLDMKLEANNKLGTIENGMYKVKSEVDQQLDFIKEENKYDTDEDLNNSQIKLKKSFICDICGKEFEKNCLLIRHKWVHSYVKPFCCDVCPKTFTSKGAVNYHKLSHTNEKPFKCDICSQTFTTKWTFEQHKLIHTGEKPFQCVDCGQLFRLKHFMKTHRKKFHTNEKPFMCDICLKTFVTKTKYEEHKLIHTGEKPHQCDECDASFRLKFVLKKHKEKIHRPHVDRLCPICGKSFEKKMALGGHMATAHPSEKQCRICSVCGLEFKNAAGLNQHQRKHSGQGDNNIECVCPECGKICKSKRALYDHTYAVHRRKHIEQGENECVCSECGKTCKSKKALQDHTCGVHSTENIESTQTDPPKIFKCLVCNKEFGKRHALYNHNYYTHLIDIVACPICGKISKNKVALSRHMKRSCVSALKLVKNGTVMGANMEVGFEVPGANLDVNDEGDEAESNGALKLVENGTVMGANMEVGFEVPDANLLDVNDEDDEVKSKGADKKVN